MEKASRIVQMYIHISKKGINISLRINLNALRKFMILCWTTLIAELGRIRPAGHRLDSPGLHCKKEKKLSKLPILLLLLVSIATIQILLRKITNLVINIIYKKKKCHGYNQTSLGHRFFMHQKALFIYSLFCLIFFSFFNIIW